MQPTSSMQIVNKDGAIGFMHEPQHEACNSNTHLCVPVDSNVVSVSRILPFNGDGTMEVVGATTPMVQKEHTIS